MMKRYTNVAGIGAVLMCLQVMPWGAGRLVAQVASSKERFELLHQSLLDLSQGYVDDVLKTIGFLLLIVGWIVTSKPARDFLGKGFQARWTGLLVIVIAAIVHVTLAIGQYNVSNARMDLLAALDYMPRAYYADAGITVTMLVANLILHVGLFALLFGLLYSLGRSGGGSSQ